MTDTIRLVAFRAMVLSGWQRLALAFVLGALSALAMPPFRLFPVLFVSFPLLAWMIDGIAVQSGGRGRAAVAAAPCGWAFGFGYFLTGLYWIGEAFLVEADIFAWMLPFAIILLPLGLGMFWGVAAAVAGLLWTGGVARLLVLACAFTGAELLRGYILSGFPWNLLGYAAAVSDAVSQAASVIGVHGLTMLVVLIAAAPALLADEHEAAGPIDRRVLAFAPIALLVAALWLAGYGRLSGAGFDAHDDVRIRVVQPNIDQREKWRSENRSAIFARYLELSDAATSPETMGIADVTHLVWPESAVPFLIEESPEALAAVAALLPPDTVLLTGALRREADAVLNSVLLIDADGRITARYDKAHLVPFGEYLPFEETLGSLGLRKLVTVPAGFLAGPGRVTLQAGEAPPLSPLVCYEIIFPGRVTPDGERPGWILNVTNDAWFGDSIGPRQHLEQARFRAIEEGLPVIRAANTGISAVIDGYGRILRRVPLNTEGVIDAALPRALPATVYARYGDLIVLLMILAGGVAAFTLAGGRSTAQNGWRAGASRDIGL